MGIQICTTKGLAPIYRGQNEVIFGNLVKSSVDESKRQRYLMEHCYDTRIKFAKIKFFRVNINPPEGASYVGLYREFI